MGNRFGNYPSKAAAGADLSADGFRYDGAHYWTKKSVTGGNLAEAPRACAAIVEIVECKVSTEYGGVSYYQLHFI